MVSGPAPQVPRARQIAPWLRSVGVILRVSRRERYLQAILDQIKIVASAGVSVHVLISFDRPSARVALMLQALSSYPRTWFRDVDLTFHILPAPGPIVSASGQRWAETLRTQYQQLREVADVQAGMLWDDDQLFSRAALEELTGHFADPPDRVEAQSLFLWDAPTQYNAKFPDHVSAVWFRVYPGDEFPEDFVVHCPESVARSDSCVKLAAPVLNFGYLTAADRERTWGAQKAAGKIDAHTLCLVQPPEITAVPPEHLILPRRKSTRYVDSY